MSGSGFWRIELKHQTEIYLIVSTVVTALLALIVLAGCAAGNKYSDFGAAETNGAYIPTVNIPILAVIFNLNPPFFEALTMISYGLVWYFAYSAWVIKYGMKSMGEAEPL
jgi:hypothetical protein